MRIFRARPYIYLPPILRPTCISLHCCSVGSSRNKYGICHYQFYGRAHRRHRRGFRDRTLFEKASLRCDRCVANSALASPYDDPVDILLTVANRNYPLGQTPQHKPLLEDIARYTSSLLARTANTTLPSRPPATDGPAVKKRKLENGDTGATAQASVDLKDGNAPLQFYVQDVSFSTPQRKKLTLEITAGHAYLRARNQATKEIEFGVSMDKIREFRF